MRQSHRYHVEVCKGRFGGGAGGNRVKSASLGTVTVPLRSQHAPFLSILKSHSFEDRFDSAERRLSTEHPSPIRWTAIAKLTHKKQNPYWKTFDPEVNQLLEKPVELRRCNELDTSGNGAGAHYHEDARGDTSVTTMYADSV